MFSHMAMGPNLLSHTWRRKKKNINLQSAIIIHHLQALFVWKPGIQGFGICIHELQEFLRVSYPQLSRCDCATVLFWQDVYWSDWNKQRYQRVNNYVINYIYIHSTHTVTRNPFLQVDPHGSTNHSHHMCVYSFRDLALLINFPHGALDWTRCFLPAPSFQGLQKEVWRCFFGPRLTHGGDHQGHVSTLQVWSRHLCTHMYTHTWLNQSLFNLK